MLKAVFNGTNKVHSVSEKVVYKNRLTVTEGDRVHLENSDWKRLQLRCSNLWGSPSCFQVQF